MNSHDSASSEAELFTFDAAFEFDYVAIDDPDEGQRFTRYWDLEPLQRGPQPVPDWLVTDRAALETELGILKTGKEAEVFLLERSVPATGESCLLAAKRYRGEDHRDFHRNGGYTEGRRVRDSRVTRAMAKKSAFGREVAAGQWAGAEWASLQRCHELGVPVPYPVQIDGTEILMELITVDGEPAPRLATTRPEGDLLRDWFEQLRAAMATMATHGFVHGDLSWDESRASDPRSVLGGVGSVGAARALLERLDLPTAVRDDLADQLDDLTRQDTTGMVTPAPRLATMRPDPALLADWFDQLRDAMLKMAGAGFVHGDLSPYNILAAGDRLVIIDLPQMVDLVANPNGTDYLLRDCTNVCAWFRRRGLDVDEQDLFGEVMTAAW